MLSASRNIDWAILSFGIFGKIEKFGGNNNHVGGIEAQILHQENIQ